MNIFNPQLCISKELTNSWAAHIESLTPNKVPIEILEGVPRLKLVHSASAPENWFAIAIPLSPTWAPQDLQPYRSLCFTIVAAEGSEEASIEIPLGDFGESLDITSIKLIKFIGYKNSAFYISQIYASP